MMQIAATSTPTTSKAKRNTVSIKMPRTTAICLSGTKLATMNQRAKNTTPATTVLMLMAFIVAFLNE